MKDINRCYMETCYSKIILGNNVLNQCNSFAIIGSLRAFNMQMYILNLCFRVFFFFLISQTYLSKDPLLLFKHFQESGFVEDSLGKGEGFLLTRAISLFPSFHELNPHCG